METIKKNQYSVILFFLIRAPFLGIIINSLFNIARQDALISVGISFIIGLIPLIIFLLLLNHDENLNINGLIDKYFNKYIGFFMKMLLCIIFIFHSSILLWNLGNFINSQFLYKTPMFIIIALFMIPIINIANKKLSTIGRTSFIFFLLTALLYIQTALALSSKCDLSNLGPFFEHGISPIIDASINVFSYCALPIFSLLIIPKNSIQNNKKLTKSILYIYIISYISLAIIIFFINTVLGLELTLFYEYPEYHILKMINIAAFIQRVESLISFQWFYDIIITLTIFIYYITKTVQNTFKTNDKLNKWIILLISLIIVILSRKLFSNNTAAFEFIIHKYKYFIIPFLFIIPLIILIKSKIKRKV